MQNKSSPAQPKESVSGAFYVSRTAFIFCLGVIKVGMWRKFHKAYRALGLLTCGAVKITHQDGTARVLDLHYVAKLFYFSGAGHRTDWSFIRKLLHAQPHPSYISSSILRVMVSSVYSFQFSIRSVFSLSHSRWLFPWCLAR